MAAILPRFNLGRFLLRHLIGLFASSQMTATVGLHAGWIFFLMGALLIPEAPDAPQTAAQAAGRLLLQALEWIGAMERDGSHYHGDLDSVMRAFATLTPVIYVMQLLVAFLRRGREPWSIKRKVLLSTVVAAVGYGAALALLPDGALAELWGFGCVLVVLTGLSTLWALIVGRLCDALVRGLT